MTVERKTERAILMLHDGINFWIQKRWLRSDNTLTPAGWKAFHIAKRDHCKHINFNALKEFELMSETHAAYLLRGKVKHPDSKITNVQFWIPHSMVCNWNFVTNKIKEIENDFPFNGVHVIWSGNNAIDAEAS